MFENTLNLLNGKGSPYYYDQASDEDLKRYFKYCLKNYYENSEDPIFYNKELKHIWFYIKIHALSEQTNKGDLKAKKMLRDELLLNAKKFENEDFMPFIVSEHYEEEIDG